MESDGSEEALDITGKDVNEGHIGMESCSLNAYSPPVVVKLLDVRSMSLNLVALSITWEETSTFHSY